MLSVGQRLQSYEILAPLTSGGMATLYLGRKRGVAGFSRLVAIKVVHPHLAKDDGFVRMFLDEALLCARIQHPNVVHVEELGEVDGSYFLAMEFVHGVTLSQLLKALATKRRGLTPEVAVGIATALADGLHAAHETRDDDGSPLGVVHRDVSPQNVLLSVKGHVKVIDFGIAKSRSRANQTVAGTLKGKFRYMSPEQAYALEVDRRTDIYALGIVLWEMLTMRRLFPGGDDVKLILQAQNPSVPPPSTINPAVGPELEAAVMAALRKDRDERPATAQAFRELLVRAMPASTQLSTSAIGGLVRELFGEELSERTRELPESASKMLRMAEHRDHDGGGAEPTPAGGFVREMTAITVSEPRFDFEPGEGEESAQPAPAASSVATGRSKRRNLGWAALALLMLALGVVGYVGFIGGVSEDDAESADAAATATPEPPEAAPDPPREETSPTAPTTPAAAPTPETAAAPSEATAPTTVDPPVERPRASRTRRQRQRTASEAPVPASMQAPPVAPMGAEQSSTEMGRSPTVVHGTPIAEEVPF